MEVAPAKNIANHTSPARSFLPRQTSDLPKRCQTGLNRMSLRFAENIPRPQRFVRARQREILSYGNL
ncbi:hypothetical protein K227x_41490 [Rubripirellula lacrimiformis]|uniref:Uncharacterized protein n=1 Tax=Rubripirellula lacrimiformis TaxID=1930273 RepID=A0A517NF45_9BACT|nr:hypothetical protein K227x_41490 [Rubripirellula lacrimiformis]